MKDHAREKDTAAWLAQEYGGSNSNSLFVVRAGSPEETQLPWPKVQRRLAQLIQEDRFYTEEEQDRFDNIDPIAIREALEERGIVNGQVADPEKLDNDPFIQQVMSDAEQIAAAGDRPARQSRLPKFPFPMRNMTQFAAQFRKEPPPMTLPPRLCRGRYRVYRG